MTAADVVDVDIAMGADTRSVGRLRRHSGRRGESATFEYAGDWLGASERFAIDPALPLGRGAFAPTRGRAVAAAIGDSAPDSWGRRLMQHAERMAAKEEGRRVRTLGMVDFLFGVSDESRLGALRLRPTGDDTYRAVRGDGVPPLLDLGRLLNSTDRILRSEETAADLALVLAPGSSLGGARPKASVRDAHGRLSIAKFPNIVDALAVDGANTGEDASAPYRRIAFNILISNLDDHLRNHGAIYASGRGWRLAPAYDLNPVPRDLKAAVLSTTIDGDDPTCSVELLRESATYFGLNDAQARRIIIDVARATRGWRACAMRFGQSSAMIDRISSAFEHDVLDSALAMDE